MNREDVDSTCIASMGIGVGDTAIPIETPDILSYLGPLGAVSATVEVEFTDGSVYRYGSVPMSAFSTWLGASSIGQWFNYNVRNRYSYVRVG